MVIVWKFGEDMMKVVFYEDLFIRYFCFGLLDLVKFFLGDVVGYRDCLERKFFLIVCD